LGRGSEGKKAVVELGVLGDNPDLFWLHTDDDRSSASYPITDTDLSTKKGYYDSCYFKWK
jgi:hypothetical protein